MISMVEPAAFNAPLFLVLTPGFGVQYAILAAPLLCIVDLPEAIWWNCTAGVFIGAVYWISRVSWAIRSTLTASVWSSPTIFGILAWTASCIFSDPKARPAEKLSLMRLSAGSFSLPLFILAFACGISQIFFPTPFGFGFGWETVAIARELARTGEGVNPFQSGASGATAVIAPLFPVYLAALIRVLGRYTGHSRSSPYLAAVNAPKLFMPPCCHSVSLLFFGEARPGIWRAFFSAFFVSSGPVASQWDAAFTACGLLLFILNGQSADMACDCVQRHRGWSLAAH